MYLLKEPKKRLITNRSKITIPYNLSSSEFDLTGARISYRFFEGPEEVTRTQESLWNVVIESPDEALLDVIDFVHNPGSQLIEIVEPVGGVSALSGEIVIKYVGQTGSIVQGEVYENRVSVEFLAVPDDVFNDPKITARYVQDKWFSREVEPDIRAPYTMTLVIQASEDYTYTISYDGSPASDGYTFKNNSITFNTDEIPNTSEIKVKVTSTDNVNLEQEFLLHLLPFGLTGDEAVTIVPNNDNTGLFKTASSQSYIFTPFEGIKPTPLNE